MNRVSKMEEKTLKPRIRVKGFTEAWEQRKLGEAGKARSGVGFPDVAITTVENVITIIIATNKIFTISTHTNTVSIVLPNIIFKV